MMLVLDAGLYAGLGVRLSNSFASCPKMPFAKSWRRSADATVYLPVVFWNRYQLHNQLLDVVAVGEPCSEVRDGLAEVESGLCS